MYNFRTINLPHVLYLWFIIFFFLIKNLKVKIEHDITRYIRIIFVEQDYSIVSTVIVKKIYLKIKTI